MNHGESISIKALIFSILALLQIPPHSVGLMLAIVFFDSFFGILKAWKLKKPLRFEVFLWGEPMPEKPGKLDPVRTSGVIGKFSILFIPFLIALAGLALKHDFNWIVEAFIYIIVANDVISILSHISTLKTGKEFEKNDFISLAITALSSFFARLIRRFITLFNNTDESGPK